MWKNILLRPTHVLVHHRDGCAALPRARGAPHVVLVKALVAASCALAFTRDSFVYSGIVH